MNRQTSAHIEGPSEHGAVVLHGDWTTHHLLEIEAQIETIGKSDAQSLRFHAEGIDAMDTGGAWLFCGALKAFEDRGISVHVEGLKEEFGRLIDLIASRLDQSAPLKPPRKEGLLAQLGHATMEFVEQAYLMLTFIGEVTCAIGYALRFPSRIRWKPFFGNLETAGVNALPIISLLSFLIGIVIAYQAGVQLLNYGANIFIVELVVLSIFRELGPLMTAIIVAGRTGSAYTAEIGTMVVTQEIDALRTIGISPLDLLVLPKVFGLMVALPLLTLVADAAGVFGGMVIASNLMDVSFADFLQRMPQVVQPKNFVIGIAKAPIFAIVIAVVGCLQGFRTSGSADSVGRQTTVSVVHSIFLVIIVDAIISILLNWMGI